MTASDWIGRTLNYIRTDGVEAGLQKSSREFRHGLARRIDPYLDGTAIFNRDWDVLVVLDACRPDLLAEAADSYDFLTNSPPTIRSKGSGSRSWMERNFTSEWSSEMKSTAYITGNPFSDELVPPGSFGLLDEVWRYGWDDEVGTIPARPITDRAIDVGRNGDFDRMLIHYMQPHFPSVPDPLGTEIELQTFGEGWESVWDDLESGELPTDRVWESYRLNLEYVLEDVSILLDNVDAKTVVISADHGNAFGEFGFYGHPPYNPIPSLRRVPWIEEVGTDNGTYEPTTDRKIEDIEEGQVQSRLADLGYL